MRDPHPTRSRRSNRPRPTAGRGSDDPAGASGPMALPLRPGPSAIGVRPIGASAASGVGRDERGASAVEFALVAPVFFLLMFIIAETALIFVAEQVMDNAVFETARRIRTGQTQAQGSDAKSFREEVCGRMYSMFDCGSGDFYLEVRSYPSFADMALAAPLEKDERFEDDAAYEFGSANDIVVVRAFYQWSTSPIFGSLSLANLANGKRLIGSVAAFRNEPFAKDEEVNP